MSNTKELILLHYYLKQILNIYMEYKNTITNYCNLT